MRIVPLAVASVLLLGVVGCSKKSAPTDAAADSSPAPVASKRPAAAADDGAYDPNSAAAQAGAAPVAEKKAAAAEGGSGKNWDAVVAEIVQIRRTPQRSSAQIERMNALEDELVGAIKSDPQAREAHQNLSRILNGR